MPAAVQAPANRPNEALTSVLAIFRILIRIGLLWGGILSCCRTMPSNLRYPEVSCYLRDYHLYISPRLPHRQRELPRLDSSRHNRGLGRDERQNQQVIPDFWDCQNLSPLLSQCRAGSLTPLLDYHLLSHLIGLLHTPPLSSPLSKHPVTFRKYTVIMLFFCLKLSTSFSESRPESLAGLSRHPGFTLAVTFKSCLHNLLSDR